MKKNNRKLFGTVSALALTLTLATTTIGSLAAPLPAKAAEATATTAPYRNVMYYGDWSIWGGEGNFYPKDIPASQLTHLNFAFLDFDSSGNLKFTDKDAAVGAPVGQEGVQWGGANAGVINALQDLRVANPNLKLGVSIGGWSKSANFAPVAANPTARANFVANVMKFIKYTNMDFVDLDWEYPASVREPDKVDNKNDEGTPNATPADKANYITLLQDLRTALDKQGTDIGKRYELTVALPASQNTLANGVDIPALFKIVDFANMMTYDMRGAWSPTSGHHTSLYGNPADPDYAQGLSVDQTVNYLTKQGVDSSKIVIGSAFYTRGWNKVAPGTNTAQPGLFQAAEKNNKDADLSPTYGAPNEKALATGDGGRAGGVWAYRSISTLLTKSDGLTEYWDDVAKAPYLYSKKTGEFYSYDNLRSIDFKTKYVKDQKLGGVISWMQSQDKATTSTKRDELTTGIKKGLFGDATLPTSTTIYAPLDIAVTVTPYSENGVGYEITVKNNEKANESNEVLKATELSFETIKLPKFTIPTNSNEVLSAGDYKAGQVSVANGNTVVDLSGVYDAQQIPQGSSYTFRLKSSAATADVSRISEINLAQRMAKNSGELGKQLIFKNDQTTPQPDPSDKEAPSIPTGLKTGTITGNQIDLTWTASTDNVKVAGYKIYRDGVEVGTTVEPKFSDTKLTASTKYSYQVTAFDASGNSSAKSGTLAATTTADTTVPDPGTAPAWDAAKAYNAGDSVTYGGKTYKAKWWTQNNIPGTEQWGPWELVN